MITNFIEATHEVTKIIQKINPIHIIMISDPSPESPCKSIIHLATLTKYQDGSISGAIFPAMETKEELYEKIKLSNKAFFVIMEQLQLSIMEKFHGK